MYYALMIPCEEGRHEDCPGIEKLPEEDIEQGVMGGGMCSCDCHAPVGDDDA